MSTTQARLSKILPILQQMVAEDEKKFEALSNMDSIVQPMIHGLKVTDPKEADGLRQFVKAMRSSTFRTFAGIEEIQQLAKKGVANALTALGYRATTDSMLDGFSGNRYYVSVIAPSDKRVLIVDQTLEVSQFTGDWYKTGLRRTFDQFKVTIADFFKFLDISKAFGQTPSIYWLHDYKVEPELSYSMGISPKVMLTEVAHALGQTQGISREQIDSATPNEHDITKIFEAMGEGMVQMTGVFDHLQQISDAKRAPLPFDVQKTAHKFLVPYINTSLLDMLEAGTLDPTSITDARILKGMCLELGLIDFLNPPWPDFVLEVASRGESTVEDAGGVLNSAERVGHPARIVQPLGISPEKVRDDPLQGLEILQQQNLVVTRQKETFTLTEPGREYVKEVHMAPKVNALRKALSDLGSKLSIGVSTPAASVTVQKKKEENDEK